MTRLRWERLRFVGKPKLNIGDEKEWFDKDRAARWLEHAEMEKAKRMRRRASHESERTGFGHGFAGLPLTKKKRRKKRRQRGVVYTSAEG
jgi:hypothetical protein